MSAYLCTCILCNTGISSDEPYEELYGDSNTLVHYKCAYNEYLNDPEVGLPPWMIDWNGMPDREMQSPI